MTYQERTRLEREVTEFFVKGAAASLQPTLEGRADALLYACGAVAKLATLDDGGRARELAEKVIRELRARRGTGATP